MGYRFGLPVIAADVGSTRDDIIEGKTGFLCKPCDPEKLSKAIETYFESGLYKDVVSEMSRAVYAEMLGSSTS